MTDAELKILKNRYYSLLSVIPARLWSPDDCKMVNYLADDADVDVDAAMASAPPVECLIRPLPVKPRVSSYIASKYSDSRPDVYSICA